MPRRRGRPRKKDKTIPASAHPHANPGWHDPYAVLAGAFLQRVVRDARGNFSHGNEIREPNRGQLVNEALSFLADDHALAFWAAVAGADPEIITDVLRAAIKRSA